jgi:hypothetical protein
MPTKEELLERARELEVEGRSGMGKDELAKAVRKAEKAAKTETDVVPSEESEELEQERLDTVEEEAGPETRELVAEELDTAGPLLVQPPSERIMTGAVTEDQAEEQEEILSDKPEGVHPAFVTEAGYVKRPVDRTDEERFEADGVDLRPYGEQIAEKLGYDRD